MCAAVSCELGSRLIGSESPPADTKEKERKAKKSAAADAKRLAKKEGKKVSSSGTGSTSEEKKKKKTTRDSAVRASVLAQKSQVVFHHFLSWGFSAEILGIMTVC